MTIRIGPRPNWLGVCTAILLMAILLGVGAAPALKGLIVAGATGHSIGGYLLGLIASLGIIVLLIYSVVLQLFEAEQITITPTDLDIRHFLFGVSRSPRSFPNSTVEKLRYEEWWSGARGSPQENGIRFDCVGETLTFAQNADGNESDEIIEKMRQIYKYPVPDPPEEEPAPGVVRW